MSALDEVDEMVRVIARVVAVAIALLIIIPVFQKVLNINVREFMYSIAPAIFQASVQG